MKDKSACALNHCAGLLWDKEHKNGSRGEGMKSEREQEKRKEKNGTRKQQQRRKIREGQGKRKRESYGDFKYHSYVQDTSLGGPSISKLYIPINKS